MKIYMINGHYKFYPDSSFEAEKMRKAFNFDLVQNGDHFIFSQMKSIPNFSIKGKSYGNSIALETCEGDHSFIFGKNKFAYNVMTGLVVPYYSIAVSSSLNFGQFDLTSDRMVQAYSFLKGQRIKSYVAFYDGTNFKISRLEYV